MSDDTADRLYEFLCAVYMAVALVFIALTLYGWPESDPLKFW